MTRIVHWGATAGMQKQQSHGLSFGYYQDLCTVLRKTRGHSKLGKGLVKEPKVHRAPAHSQEYQGSVRRIRRIHNHYEAFRTTRVTQNNQKVCKTSKKNSSWWGGYQDHQKSLKTFTRLPGYPVATSDKLVTTVFTLCLALRSTRRYQNDQGSLRATGWLCFYDSP